MKMPNLGALQKVFETKLSAASSALTYENTVAENLALATRLREKADADVVKARRALEAAVRVVRGT